MNRGANFLLNFQKKIGNEINVMMIGIIKSYDSNTNTAEIIPLHTVPETESQEYPPLVSVPVGFFNIGGYSIKVQPKTGDRFILLFSDYDIENLLIDGTKTNKTKRTHAVEDCIALPLSINFLNERNNATQDLTIAKDGTSTYIKIKNDGTMVLNSSKIQLGENATKGVVVSDGANSSISSKVFAE